MKTLSLLLLLFLQQHFFAQTPSSFDRQLFLSNAEWISFPGDDGRSYGVYHFRRHLHLNEVPEELPIKISADNRYKLYVNGQYITFGPARGDEKNWRYEELDIAPFLQKGNNIIATVVWNGGEYAPLAQHSVRTGLWLQAEEPYDSISTGKAGWKVMHNSAYTPVKVTTVKGYYVCGATEKVDASAYPWGWEALNYDDATWKEAQRVRIGYFYGYVDGVERMLVPRKIPLMEHTPMPIGKIRRTEAISLDEDAFLKEKAVVVPPNQKVSVLVDMGKLTIGYPVLVVNDGAGSAIKISYAEALYDSAGIKGNRNEIEGKRMIGYFDIFLPDGEKNRKFEPLQNRTWRYLQLEIETGSDALEILQLSSFFSAYPFQLNAKFETNEPLYSTIFDVGWHTARMCAREIYFDCPYYEQLQYVGDTRIQALISLYLSGDDRLMRNAIELTDNSRLSFGLTQSRYPSNIPQIIPPFSLYWINMVHDYYMHRTDDQWIQQFLPGIRSVIGWFDQHIDSTGLFTNDQWWNFSDWSPYFDRGTAHGAQGGYSSVLNLQLLHGLQSAIVLADAYGNQYDADYYREIEQRVKNALQQLCWNEERGLFAQTPEQKVYSQHANVMGLLTDAIPIPKQQKVMQQVLFDSSLIESSIYYKFYLFRALVKTGMADKYLSLLDDWQTMLDLGLTTFLEELSKQRSDCHAWSASPCYDFLATVAGIRPASPGFATVLINPAPGNLQEINASMPHPKGTIRITLKKQNNNSLHGIIELPEGLNGEYQYRGLVMPLKGGENKIR